jgi:hypothetical protein
MGTVCQSSWMAIKCYLCTVWIDHFFDIFNLVNIIKSVTISWTIIIICGATHDIISKVQPIARHPPPNKNYKPAEVRKTCIPRYKEPSCVLLGKSPLIQTTQVASCKKFKPLAQWLRISSMGSLYDKKKKNKVSGKYFFKTILNIIHNIYFFYRSVNLKINKDGNSLSETYE